MTPLYPNQNLERIICRSPNRGPNVAKKATGMVPSMFIKIIVKAASKKPSLKTGLASMPTANVATVIFADSHCRRGTRRMS